MKAIIAFTILFVLTIGAVGFTAPNDARKTQITQQIKALQAEKKQITKASRVEKALERLEKAKQAVEKAKSIQ
jgi:uncharacterized protein HemX